MRPASRSPHRARRSRTASPPLALASWSVAATVASSSVTDVAVRRGTRQSADAHGDAAGAPSTRTGGSTSRERRPRQADDGLERRSTASGPATTQELVGAVAAHHHVARGGRRRMASATASSTSSPARWPWVSLSSRKLSMSTSATPRRRRRRGRARSRRREVLDERAVVQRLGRGRPGGSRRTSAAVCRLMRCLRRPEHEEQHGGRDQRGGQDHDDDVAPQLVEPARASGRRPATGR